MKYLVKFGKKVLPGRCVGVARELTKQEAALQKIPTPNPYYRPTGLLGSLKKLAFGAIRVIAQRRLRHRIQRAADYVAIRHHADQALRTAPVHGAP